MSAQLRAGAIAATPSPRRRANAAEGAVVAGSPRTSPRATPRTNTRNLKAFVRATAYINDPPNTKLAYDSKMEEFGSFCDHYYPSVDPAYRYTVNGDRLYTFLFYQSFREKKSQKGRTRGTRQGFDSV